MTLSEVSYIDYCNINFLSKIKTTKGLSGSKYYSFILIIAGNELKFEYDNSKQANEDHSSIMEQIDIYG